MSENKNGRFESKQLSDEYSLLFKAIPHYYGFQELAGSEVATACKEISGETVNVVEIGTGSGETTEKIIVADPRIRLVSIDNEPKMLNQARAKFENESRISFLEKDAMSALKEMKDASADIIVSAWVIHNMPPEYRTALFSEIKRVLKSKGWFINVDKIAFDDEAKQKECLDEQQKRFEIFIGAGRQDLHDEWHNHYVEDEKIKLTEIEIRSALSRLNFTNISVTNRVAMDALVKAQNN